MRTIRTALIIYGCLVISLILCLSSCGDDKSFDQSKTEDNASLSSPSATTSVIKDTKAFQRVLRLNIQYKDGNFSILNGRVDIANPTPLPKVVNQAPFLVQTLSKSGKILFSGGIHNPRLAQLDIEDPDHHGTWQHKDIALSESLFQMKIPIEDELSELRIIDNTTANELSRLDLTPYLEDKQQ